MCELILIRGLPGSGKSTMAQNIIEWLNEYDIDSPCHYEADMYFIRPDGEYDFNRELIRSAHAWCQTMVKNAMAMGDINIIVSNTFVKKWEMQPYLDMAAEFNYSVKILEATGSYQSVHGVPQEVIERMRSSWETMQ